jgi:hypothetical protein
MGAELVDIRKSQPAKGQWRIASRHPGTLRASMSGSSAAVVCLDFFAKRQGLLHTYRKGRARNRSATHEIA